MTTLINTDSIHRSPLRLALLLIPLVSGCFALSPMAQAVSPPPDGGYPGANTAEGQDALFSLTTGNGNTALGFDALYHNTTGYYNTASGYRALFSNTTGIKNTADGFRALYLNTTGGQNTAEGFQALYSNISGVRNTANGLDALFHNTTGNDNTAIGWNALFNNKGAVAAEGGRPTGSQNTAVGSQALLNNVRGQGCTAVGFQADMNSTGISNDAFGFQALVNVTDGDFNVGIGVGALMSNVHGFGNTAVGNGAGDSATSNGGVFIGDEAGDDVTTASNVICIGALGANTDNSCFIGNISGATAAGGAAVFVTSGNKLGTVTSSRRFKDDIKPMDKASEAIFALKPVTFRYKKELDPDGIQQFGLVAEEVEKVNPALIALDKEGKPYTVRYEQVNAMMLNEFLKEHQTVEQQGATITRQRKDFEAAIAQQQKQIEALTEGLQKVSAQLEVGKPAPQTVLNDQ